MFISFLVIGGLLSGGFFYLSGKMSRLLPELIDRISHGHYRLDYQSIRLHFLRPEIEISGARLTPVDGSQETEYHVSLDTFRVRLRSVWPLLLQEPVQVQSLRIVHPTIVARRMHARSKPREGALHDQVRRMKEQAVTFLRALQVENASLVGGAFQFYPFPNQERHFQLKNIGFHIQDLKVSEAASVSAAMQLEVNQPELVLPDTTLSAGISRFQWDSRTGKVDAGDLFLSRHPGPGRDSFLIRLEAVQIRTIHWMVWLDSGIVRLDTLLANDGILKVSSPSSPRSRKGKRTPLNIRQLKFWDAIGNLDIRHLAARTLQASLVQQLPDRERNYSLLGDSLVINRLSVRPEAVTPLNAADLAVSVRAFTDKGAGNRFRTSFSRLHLSGNTLELDDYSIISTRQSGMGIGSSLYIPAVFLDGISFQSIFDKIARIRQITLESPVLQIRAVSGKKSFNRFSGLEDLRPYLDVEWLRIRNASVQVHRQEIDFYGKGIFADVKTREVLSARSPEALLNSLRNVMADSLHLTAPSLQAAFRKGVIDYRRRSLRFGRMSVGNKEATIQGNFQEVHIVALPEFQPLVSNKKWSFQKLDVGSGSLNIRPSAPAAQKKILPLLSSSIDTLRIGELSFLYADASVQAKAGFSSIQAANARLQNGALSWQLAHAAGHSLALQLPGTQVSARRFLLNADGESVLDSAFIRLQKPGIDATIQARQVITQEQFRSFDPDTLVFDRIVLVRPLVHAILSAAPTIQKDQRTFLVGTSAFVLEDPSVRLSFPGKSDPLHLETGGSLIAGDHLYLDQVKGKPRFSVGRLLTNLDTSAIRSEGQDIFRSGRIDLSIRQLIQEPEQNPVLDIDEFSIQGAVADWISRGDTLQWKTDRIRLQAVNRLFLQKDSVLRSAFKLPPLRIEPGSFLYHTPRMKFDIEAFEADTEKGFLQWDSLLVQNRTPREQFFREQGVEKDYFSFSTGRLRAEDLRPLLIGGDTIAYARKLLVDPLHLRVERDKRLPDDTIRYRPLLAGMLKRLPFPLILDTLQLRRSVIWHNLIDEKTEKEGTIFFTNLEALVQNIRNTEITSTDSIRLRAHSRLMGKGPLDMYYQEAYTDPRKAFRLNVAMGAMEMQELNRLIVPLQNVRADEGTIRRIAMQVKGTDSIAWGTIRMEYDKLKVSVINSQEKRQSLVSLLANLFVRGKNTRTNRIYTERLPEKAVFNYWSRISLNGLLTSMGVRTNHKKNRQFFRNLDKNSRLNGAQTY